MKLTQYYNQHVKQLGFACWNTYCALVPEQTKNDLKNRLKREYKNLIKTDKDQKTC